MGGRQMVERIAARYPNVSLADVPNRHAGAWSELARRLRLGIDYFRFLDPRYAKTIHFLEAGPGSRAAHRRATRELEPGLLARWSRGHLPHPAVPRARHSRCASHRRVHCVAGARRPADHAARGHRLAATRSSRRGTAAWRANGAAGGELGSPVEQVAAACGSRAGHSLEREAAHEAIEMHGVPADRIVVTGAQCYDQWFDRTPALGYRRSAIASVCAPTGRTSCMSARRCSGARHSSRRSPSVGFRRFAAAPIRA